MTNGLASERVNAIKQGEGTTVDDLVIGLLDVHGPKTIEDLVAVLPAFGWSAVFLAVDRLSRTGRLLLRPCGRAGYQASLKS